MTKIKNFFSPFLFFLSINIFAYKNTNASDYVYDKHLTNYKYFSNVHKFQFISQGISLEMAYMYLPSNNQYKGTITLLHGKNFTSNYWKEIALKLNSLGYAVLIPDQIGFGKSSKPLNYQFTFEALASNTKNLLDSLDITSTQLIAHSMGGMLASRFSLIYADIISNLILINPIGLENYLEYVEYKDISFFYKKELQIQPENIISYQKKNYYDGNWNENYELLASHLIGWINGEDWDSLAKISAKTYDMIFTGSVIEDFKKFKVPVSLILGTRDRTGPGRNWKKTGVNYDLGRYDLLGKRVKKMNSNINLIELEGLGHLPQIEDFESFYSELEKVLLN
jgi:pimeloyl-ACP methyl ester carboxylesterase